MKITDISVIGGGSWATALVKILTENNIHVHWYIRSEATAAAIRNDGANPRYLSNVMLPEQYVSVSTNLEEIVNAAETILIAIPSAYMRSTLQSVSSELFQGKYILTSIKGMLPELDVTPAAYMRMYCGMEEMQHGVIGGPCHAEEVGTNRKTYMTIASKNPEIRQVFCKVINSPYIHMVSNDDPHGTELSAIMKNIMGVACGMSDALQYGHNFQAVLVSNAMREMQQLLHAIDPIQRDMTQSAYFGDLLVTVYSKYSRNRMLGQLIGKGYRLEAATAAMPMIAEGYYAVKGIYDMGRKMQIDMPVTTAVYRMLYHQSSPVREFKLLENKLQ